MTSVRSRVRAAVDGMAKKVFPDHWSFLLGEVAMAALAVLFITGTVLAFFYDASGEPTTYEGSYEALRGVEVSRAYESVLRLSFDVPGGLLLRQVHHWAALVFIATVILHLARIFFTGAYRRPRRLNYAVGITLLLAGLANGFFGVSLPDDLLSASGARIGYALTLSIPVIGPGLANLLVGGEFPSAEMVNRFWLLHVFVIPAVLAGLFSLHMALVWRQTHTQFRSEGPADKVVGSRLLPSHAMKTGAVVASVAATLVLLASLFQISPIWVYGPFDPAAATVPAGPDWYLMFVEGGLRVLPALHVSLGPVELPSPLLAGILLPASFFAILYLWPFIDERVTGDREVHHVLERPRDRPGRTALGVAGLSFLAVLTLAANHDYLGGRLGVDVVTMTVVFRALLVTVPPIAGLLTWKLALDLRDEDPPPAPPPHVDAAEPPAPRPEPPGRGRARAVGGALATFAGGALAALLLRRRGRRQGDREPVRHEERIPR